MRVYLAHILESIDKIERFTAGGRDVFMHDPLVQDAVVRNLEIIGEAAKRVDEAFRADHPAVPWRRLAGLRDVLIHQYAGIDVERVWAVVARDLPQIRHEIRSLIPRPEELERELAGDGASPAEVDEDTTQV